jgi:hypothetical protein
MASGERARARSDDGVGNRLPNMGRRHDLAIWQVSPAPAAVHSAFARVPTFEGIGVPRSSFRGSESRCHCRTCPDAGATSSGACSHRRCTWRRRLTKPAPIARWENSPNGIPANESRFDDGPSRKSKARSLFISTDNSAHGRCQQSRSLRNVARTRRLARRVRRSLRRSWRFIRKTAARNRDVSGPS